MSVRFIILAGILISALGCRKLSEDVSPGLDRPSLKDGGSEKPQIESEKDSIGFTAKTPPDIVEAEKTKLPNDTKDQGQPDPRATVNYNSRNALANSCAALVKTITTEPWFYNFQATIRKQKTKNTLPEFVRGHMIFKKIGVKGLANSDLNRCAEAVLTIDSFPELKKIQNASLEKRQIAMSQKIALINLTKPTLLVESDEPTHSSPKKFSIDSCMKLISAVADPEELETLKHRLRLNGKGSEKLISEFLSAAESNIEKPTALKITPIGCISAIKSLKDFEAVSKFAKASNSERLEMIGSFSTY